MVLHGRLHKLVIEVELMAQFQEETGYQVAAEAVIYAAQKLGFVVKTLNDSEESDELFAFKIYVPELGIFSPTLSWEVNDTFDYQPLVEWLRDRMSEL